MRTKIVRLLEIRLKKNLEDLDLLGCDIVLLSHWFLVFQHNTLPYLKATA